MDKQLHVGDVVEIVGSHLTQPEWRHWLGRVGIITAVHVWYSPGHELHGCPYAVLSPKDLNGVHNMGWFFIALRKINPPDWQAPLMTDEELSA